MKEYLLLTERLVGVDYHVEEVTKRLNKGVKVVGIVGMGGLGKTTIAMKVRDEVYTKFNYHCFLRDVTKTLSENGGGILALQKQVILDVTGDDGNIRDESQGIRVIKDRVSGHKTLIIIDDAGKGFEFAKIFGELKEFLPQSRFIITTRNKEVLQDFPEIEIEMYEPEELNYKDSLQLFSIHAFKSDYPQEGWEKISEQVVEVATGLPLALKLIGAGLHRKDKGFWEEKLEQLKKIPHGDVKARLMTSYSDLSLEGNEIALDIACNFIGEKKELPFYMWRASNFSPEIEVYGLILKSLIKINENNEFWMHDLLRDIGRDIVREEDTSRPWRRSRIWTNEDALTVLTNKKVLSNLRYLKVYGGNFETDFESNLPNLRWLQLIGCRSLPIHIMNLKGLAVFKLEDCGGLTDDWSGWGKLKGAHNLKALDIWDCQGLTKAPDLSECENLELLNFDRLYNMSGEVDIGNLMNLKILNIGKSSRRIELIGEIGKLQNLKEIHIKSLVLGELPADAMAKLHALEILDIPHSKFIQAPKLPTSLKQLYLSSLYLPNLLDLVNLEKLCISGYQHPFPGDIWKLSKLKSIEILGATQLMHLQGLEQLTLIKVLFIGDCDKLEKLPRLQNMTEIQRLEIYDCPLLTEFSDLHGLKNLKSLRLIGFKQLTELKGVDELESLQDLKISDWPLIKKLPSLSRLKSLLELEISSCVQLREIAEFEQLSSFPGLRNVVNMSITNCPLMKNLPDLSRLKHLWKLDISRCTQMTQVIGIENLEELRFLHIDEGLNIPLLLDQSRVNIIITRSYY
ncbi:Disease resistance protein L6 [Linum perenne]